VTAPGVAGSLTNRIVAQAAQADGVPANNSAQWITTVQSVQPVFSPRLSIRLVTNNLAHNVVLSWTNAAGFRLQRNLGTNGSLVPAAGWSNVVTAPVLSQGTNSVTLPATTNSYFRLRNP
jgi:hypothetical protein